MTWDDALTTNVTNSRLEDSTLSQSGIGNLGVDPALEVTPTFQASTATSSLQANLLLRNSNSGANQVRSISGTTESSRQNLPSLSGSGWKVLSSGDFNRDGQDDLLWQNSSTGETRIWQLSGSTIQSFNLLTVNDANWQVVGLADFNSDGAIDIFWQNRQTSRVDAWVMNGTQLQRSVTIGTASSGWRVQALGDFNGNGFADLVWQNVNTGQTALWLLNGSQARQDVWLDSAPTAWKIEGVGDFNGDRSLDIFWQNDSTGETGFWFYRGTQRLSTNTARLGDLSWNLIGTRDLNGDQTSDLLWSNPTTGQTVSWLVNNGSVNNTALLLSDSNWQVVADLRSNEASETRSSVSNGTIATAENQTPSFSRSDRVDSTNSSDFYRFTIGQSGIFTAGLTGLSGDADVRLIQDSNNNGTIDSGEILAWQWERGTTSESVRRFLSTGTYFVQVLNYNNQTADYSLNTSFTAATSDDQQFRISLVFSDTLNGLSTAARNAITQAAQFWENIITSRSAITRSNTLTITLTGESLTFSDGTADTGTLAISGPTFTVDSANNLVITRGSSTLNSRKFSEYNSNPDYLRLIMIHEFVHVFGFGTAWEPVEFVLSNGTRFTAGKTWINTTSVTYNANSYAGYAYGDLLGTSTPTAVPIEPRIFAHWDETRFDTELMTPFAESPGTSSPLSSLTLAALRDLGWNVNMGAAQAYALSTSQLRALSTSEDSSNSSSTSGRAAYKCACSRCIAGVRTELSPSLSEAIGVSV